MSKIFSLDSSVNIVLSMVLCLNLIACSDNETEGIINDDSLDLVGSWVDRFNGSPIYQYVFTAKGKLQLNKINFENIENFDDFDFSYTYNAETSMLTLIDNSSDAKIIYAVEWYSKPEIVIKNEINLHERFCDETIKNSKFYKYLGVYDIRGKKLYRNE